MPEEVVQTPFGRFQIWPHDLIGSTTKAGTLWDGHCLQPIAKEYGRLGERGVTILDVGAHIGTFSVWLAAHGAWRVLAVEPHPGLHRMLKANLDLNRDVCDGVVIPLEVAGWDRPARLCLDHEVPLATDGNSGGHYVREDEAGDIQGVALDTYDWLFGTSVSLIVIDAEGADFRIIAGLERTIRQHRPTMVFEWNPDTVSEADLHATIRSLTARAYGVHEWPTHPHNYVAIPLTIP